MGSFLSKLRAFGTAGLCTIALFAIAAWIPNDTIDFAAWLVAVLLGLPASILTKVQAARTAAPSGRLVLAAHKFLPRALGALSMFLGVGILGWQAYNLIARGAPEFTGLTAVAQALLVAMLVAFGYRVLIRSVRAKHTPPDKHIRMTEELKRLNDVWIRAWFEKDAAVVDDLMTPDYEYVSPKGQVLNRADILKIIRSPGYGLTSGSRTEVTLREIARGVVLVKDRWQGTGTFEGQTFTDDHRCSRLWVRRSGKWRLAYEHCSAITG